MPTDVRTFAELHTTGQNLGLVLSDRTSAPGYIGIIREEEDKKFIPFSIHSSYDRTYIRSGSDSVSCSSRR